MVPNEPYRITSIRYIIEDTTIVSAGSYRYSPFVPIHKGEIMDMEMLQKERQRIETSMKNNGYYRFSKEYIHYEARVIPSTLNVDLTMIVKEFVEGEQDPKTKLRPHHRYRINRIYVNPDYSPLDLTGPAPSVFDTTFYDGIGFFITTNQRSNSNVIIDKNRLHDGNYYNLNDVDRHIQKSFIPWPFQVCQHQFQGCGYRTRIPEVTGISIVP